MTADSPPNGWHAVVGVDGSAGSEHALEWALAEAGLHQGRLEVVHAWAPPVAMSAYRQALRPIDPAPYEEAASSTLAEAVRCADDAADAAIPVTAELVRGYPSTTLVEIARRSRLLVLGSRGRGGFSGLLLGSVSQQCTHYASVPVAVIPSGAPLPGKGDVVVGVDGSQSSYVALRLAADEADLRGVRLSVVNAWQPPYVGLVEGVAYDAAALAAHREQSERLLRDMVDATVRTGLSEPGDIEVLPIELPPAQALLERARDAELLVVGSRGRGGFAGLVLGSVSQHCVRHSPCAVIVVPHRDHSD